MYDYPSRSQWVRWRIARRHLNSHRPRRLRWALALALTLMLLVVSVSGAGAMYFVSTLPSIDRFHIRYDFQNARIYDSQGHLLFNMADLSATGGRRVVEPLQRLHDRGSACRNHVNRIPLLLQSATIATEDATFYKNPGFDPLSILRAAYQNWQSGHIVSGASTITQQIVRAELLTDEQTLDRKVQEIALAYEVTKKYSKRKLLAFYLNSVPYGNLTAGAEAASEVYFHQPICSIDQAQAALLAGLPRAPTDYDPIRHRSVAIARMHDVLKLMYKHGYLHTPAEIDAAMAEARYWQFSPPSSSMHFPAFVQYVLDQIKTMPNLRRQLYKGLDIYTTINPILQEQAQTTVTHQIDALKAKHVTDGALVTLDLRPRHYGWILAMVGSAHYNGRAGQINMAVRPRQPGSSMKPFNYIYAFEHGINPATAVLDLPVQLPDPNDIAHYGWYVPSNYDRQFHGPVTVRQALANSLNLPAVKVEYYITGPHNVAQTARRFGMSSLYHDNPGLDCSVCYSVTLGGLAHGTRLVEETAAYGVFATGGMTVPPQAIWKVVQRNTGQTLFCSADCPPRVHPPAWLLRERQRVLDAAHAYEMTDVLADNGSRCVPRVCEFGLSSPLVLSHPAAAKTGTTNAFTDNWTLGYTPQLVTGVWTGNADSSRMNNVIGVTGAAPIWHNFMEHAFYTLRLPSVPFVAPAGVERTARCLQPGAKVASPGIDDIYIANDPLPLCRLPDRGPLPVSCNDYPQPAPVTFQCVYQTGVRYNAAYASPNTYPYNGTFTTPGTTGTYPQPYGQGTSTYPQPYTLGTGTYQQPYTQGTGSYQQPP